ncbi:probable serine/threonine-protein kinase PBL9 isoform X3 [Arachis hypogaea]|uniref:probable serine/threonine-protein kinase PBL9 isoform X3 n=1 Tax=Arachis hypogaea TaxID=3818 RepID=UPI000DED0364|nr:probable serine/threonine-protein kinase PBL9 isoform X3 [Arachis hypogaea]
MGVCLSAQVKVKREGEIFHCSNLKSFSLSELKKATRNFHPNSLLGGGFGSVFKGWIDENSLMPAKPGTGIGIAVKRLKQSGLPDHTEWLAEVNYHGQFSHPHLVRLIGYCLENKHRLLVYEFMPRGSLDNHLFSRTGHSLLQPLSWSLRLKVALHVAKGLAFLHSAETKLMCVHFNTTNVLLDSNYNAKLSVFGLPKHGQISNIGHAFATEFISGHSTAKATVYNFGVVLLEMFTGERLIDRNRPTGQLNLMEWVRPYLANKCKVLKVLDTHLEGQYSVEEAYELATLTLRCISSSPRFRPKIDEVVTLLEQLQAPNNADLGNQNPSSSESRPSASILYT